MWSGSYQCFGSVWQQLGFEHVHTILSVIIFTLDFLLILENSLNDQHHSPFFITKQLFWYLTNMEMFTSKNNFINCIFKIKKIIIIFNCAVDLSFHWISLKHYYLSLMIIIVPISIAL